MKKSLIYAFAFLFLMNLVFALDWSNITAKDLGFIDAGQKVVENGKTITLVSTGGTKAIFNVDGELKAITTDGVVSGVWIAVDGVFDDPARAMVKIYVPFNCGDAICDDNESYRNCCTDCNCSKKSESCISNQCSDKSLNKCEFDWDCSDNISCTKDTCEGSPAECKFVKITECKKADGCCPAGCIYQYDKDCPKPDQCKTDVDCDDKSPCTIDYCAGDPRKVCIHNSTEEGCGLEGKCVPIGSITNKTYCENITWVEQKQDLENCTKSYECINSCSNGICKQLGFFDKIISFFKNLF
ncbi:MAG: hypothetical protein WC413_00675 [Candidatus Nanoarchaeia archaeon]